MKGSLKVEAEVWEILLVYFEFQGVCESAFREGRVVDRVLQGLKYRG